MLLVDSNLHILSRRLSDTDVSTSITLGDDGCDLVTQPQSLTSNSGSDFMCSTFSSSPIVKLSLGERSRAGSGASIKELDLIRKSSSKETRKGREQV